MMRFLAVIIFTNTWALGLSWGQTPAAPLLTVPVPAHPGDTTRLPEIGVTAYVNGRGCAAPESVILIHNEPPPRTFLTIQPLLTIAPGVQVTPHSGAPGDWATVRIRGGSLAGTDQPLYVVDGVPMLNADFAPGVAAGVVYDYYTSPRPAQAGPNPLLALPVADVERVEIVAGAIGTAQYGAQGSNGVVLITTKRGGEAGLKKPLRVSYTGFGGVQQVRQRYELLDARQYADLANEAWANASGPGRPRNPPFSADALAQLGAGTDWQAELFRPAILQSHHLALDGSGKRTRYLASADYLNQDGVVRGSGLRRYALRLNLDQQVAAHLHLFLNTSATRLTQALPGRDAVAAALLAPPTLPAYAADGSYFQTNSYYQYGNPKSVFFNPLALATDAGYATTSRRVLLQAGMSYELPKLHLKATVSASREQASTDGTGQALVTIDNSPAPPAPLGSTGTSQAVTVSTTQLTLGYDHALGANAAHHLILNATAGQQRYERSQSSFAYNPNVSLGSEATSASYVLANAAFAANYTYRERYQLLASLRADASQTSGLYPAVPTTWLPGAEVRWHLHQEGFMAKAAHTVSTATLWAGMGASSNTSLVTTGLGSTPLPTYIAPVLIVGPGGNLSYSSPTGIAPARTTQLEAGLRTGFFGGHLQVNLTAYRRSTAHLSLPQVIALPSVTGYGSYTAVREASLNNEGLLLEIGSSWRLGRLGGSSRVAAALQQQRIGAVADDGSQGPVPGLVVGEAPHPYLLYQREAVGTNFSFYSTGQSAAGRIRFQDLDGDHRLSDADARYQGTALPTQLLTISQSLYLGRITLDVQLDAQGGHQLLNTTLARLELPTGNTNGTTALLDRWTPTHYNVEIPQANPAIVPPRYDNYTPQRADNLRLTQLTLSYALRPASGPHPLSVWAGGQNLFVITKYQGFDPNVSSGGATQLAAGYDTNAYPVPRIWMAGVRATF